MTSTIDDGDLTLYHGDALDVLRTLPAGIAQTCVTSPPYWGLRDYGTGTWSGGDPGCDHTRQSAPSRASSGLEGATTTQGGTYAWGDLCGRCGAQRVDAQLGLEATPEQYVAKMVEVFREVRRCLRDDGTLWLNIGDSYAGGGPSGAIRETDGFDGAFKSTARSLRDRDQAKRKPLAGLKPKDLVGIPWRLAFALQADGWYLRSDIIWSKPNPMPESVTDRPTKSHEYVFLFSKQPRYFYDADAVREARDEADIEHSRRYGMNDYADKRTAMPPSGGKPMLRQTLASGRNLRSVWQIATQPFPEAHFATYPEELVRRCILAGTSERGECVECGAPWERLLSEADRGEYGGSWHDHSQDTTAGNGQRGHVSGKPPGTIRREAYQAGAGRRDTTGWEPSCSCSEPAEAPPFMSGPISDARQPPAVPQLVLDPFVGSGTTSLVARKHGRRSIGIDLSSDYLAIAAKRTQQLSLLALDEEAT